MKRGGEARGGKKVDAERGLHRRGIGGGGREGKEWGCGKEGEGRGEYD
jgi:hypothetical protein